jgi:protocatechuate 3,4-dioxygenase alpha subunit
LAAPTPSQTVGPFFRIGLATLAADLVEPGSPGAVRLVGRVLDGAGDAVPDAVVEVWQADADGRLAARDGWTGFGRALADATGTFQLTTVVPGRVDEAQAPHLDLSIFARGLLQRLVTRCYPPAPAPVLDADPLLASLDPARRRTLLAVEEARGVLRFDVHLQGPDETVFLAW